jgi:hypothetical protein
LETQVQKVKIYVRLLGEGTDVVRPTEAVDLGHGLLKILPTPDYDSEDEHWEFPPGSTVAVQLQEWPSGKILVAVAPAKTGMRM